MIAKLPVISSPVNPQDLAEVITRFTKGGAIEEFKTGFRNYAGLKHIELANSGMTIYYMILKALKERYQKTEVILPAYTAGSLVVAIRKAGLKPVLCDISLADFNADVNELIKMISEKTLALTCIHMFGIGMEGIMRVREHMPPATVLIEDCAQSMGSAISNRLTGTFGDISFFSFSRGKNLPISGGGCLGTNSDILADILKNKDLLLKKQKPPGISDIIKNIAFLYASKPYIYGVFYPIISRFKESAPPADIEIGCMNDSQAALGIVLMRKREEIFKKRRENGMRLMNGLKDIKGVLLPVISEGNFPVFNRMPIVFEDGCARRRCEELLWYRGIESSRMYLRPLHHIFDLGYREDEFPHANYLAQRLLTLPVHQAVTDEHIDIMVQTVKDILK